ncbi:putative oxidoreductase CzcO [Paenibacillus plantiphilus]|uniref:Oxidoreductase CzcO n=1 Tax=Paenibacillus plantiphilus TaxID=2905650 RepID=A0ABN8GRP4_9BACL|nr:NAD(P)/FAD-dependent oxidoreductase [Paenibacillus plantiphilus]CAH1216255.1 putative oxidoreductase CzcO [Paenibacillus plantiphilus]
MNASYQVVIIGASQAGLVMGYYLNRCGVSYVIVGKEERIGDVWRNRYDSLVLFTPRWINRLPGRNHLDNLDPGGYADKDEIADELERYASEHLLNVRMNTLVTKLTRETGGFVVETNKGNLTASHVVIATGPFQQPSIPDFASQLSAEDVFQVHTAHYRNADQLQDGDVLIVGCGNSGAQIAMELSRQGRAVFISGSGAMKCVPREIGGESIFWWFEKLGLYKAHIATRIGKKLSKRGDPIIGTELKSFIKRKTITVYPRAAQASHDTIIFNDGTHHKARNVIWATGYKSDYSWIDIPDAINEHEKPNHIRGVSQVNGLFFLGLPWQHNRGSALIGGVAADAEYIMNRILKSIE